MQNAGCRMKDARDKKKDKGKRIKVGDAGRRQEIRNVFVGRIRTAGTHPTGRPLVACFRLETWNL